MFKRRFSRIFILIGIVCLFTLLASYNKVDSKISVQKIQYVKTTYTSSMNNNAKIIRTMDALQQYIDSYISLYENDLIDNNLCSSTFSFINLLKTYDRDFFNNNNLILVSLVESSGSITHEVKDLNIVNNYITINIDKNIPDYGTCDMATWCIIIEVNKVSDNDIKIVYN